MEGKKSALEILKDIFNNVNNWLNFAELKNGTIIVFDATFISGIISKDVLKNISSCWLYLIIGLISISLILSMLSFYPKLKTINDKWRRCNKAIKVNRNLIFYGDIFELSSVDYIKRIYKDYLNENIDVNNINKIELDYVDEIIVNSKISMFKYSMFNKALIMASASVICTLLSQVVRIMK